MKTVHITKFNSSLLNSEFDSVFSFEIEDLPFDSGAFGEVYLCKTINGNRIASSQVLKIFIDDGSGSSQRGFQTINKLQEQIKSLNKRLKAQGKKALEDVIALSALPQFSFEGQLNGKTVLGYSANKLDKTDWLLFGDIFNEPDLQKRKTLRTSFYNLALDHRLKMAYDLAEGFAHLEQMKFIYADLNPKNFFVNEKLGNLCIIDYEGGAINDNPETYGKPGEWLAPEIQNQLLKNNSPIIKVDLNTDTWAVAIGIHFMIFQFHPLFFLKVRGKKEMEDYFKNYSWPNISKKDVNFRDELEGIYDWYLDKLKQDTPKELYKSFSETINYGYNNPNKRLSYSMWLRTIKGLMQPPNIGELKADSYTVIDGMPITLSWNIDSKAHTIIIDNGVGDVTGKSHVKVYPNKNTTFTIKAVGHFGSIEKSVDIRVFPTPIIESLIVPAPDLRQYINVNPLKIEPFNIDLSIKIHTNHLYEVSEHILEGNKNAIKFSKVIEQVKGMILKIK